MKQIESYHISKSDYGIISLIVNTRDRWINYNGVLTYSSEHQGEGFSIETFEGEENTGELFIPKSEFSFDKGKEIFYLESHSQEKEQIYYYWIPVRLIKGDKYIERFKRKQNDLPK